MVTSNVIPLGNITKLNLPTDQVLEAAKGDCSDGVVVIGYDNDGELYFASSIADGGDVLWLMEKAKMALLEIGEWMGDIFMAIMHDMANALCGFKQGGMCDKTPSGGLCAVLHKGGRHEDTSN